MFGSTTDTCYDHLIQRGEYLLKDNYEKYQSYVMQQEALRLQFINANNDYNFLKSWLDIACEDSLMMKSDHGDLTSLYKVLLQNNFVKEILDYEEAQETLQLRFIELMSRYKDLKTHLDAGNENVLSLKSVCDDSSRRNEILSKNVSAEEFLDYTKERETLHLKWVETIDECECFNKRLSEAYETITVLNAKRVDLSQRFLVLSTNEMVKEFLNYAKDQEKLKSNVDEKNEEDEYSKLCIDQANENIKILNSQLAEIKKTLLMERLRFEQVLNEKQSLSYLSEQLRCLLSKYQAKANENTDAMSPLIDESVLNSVNMDDEFDSSFVSETSIPESKVDTEDANLRNDSSDQYHRHSDSGEKNNDFDGSINNGEPASAHFSEITISESKIETKDVLDLCDDRDHDNQISNSDENDNGVSEVKNENINECTEVPNDDLIVCDKSPQQLSETVSSPKMILKLDSGVLTDLCCNICGQFYSTTSSLQEHINNSHNGTKNKPTRELELREEVSFYQCEHCHQKYRNKNDLSDHNQIHMSGGPNQHTNNSYDPKEKNSTHEPKDLKDDTYYHCAHCRKKYSAKRDISDHMKIHTNSLKQRQNNVSNQKKKQCTLEPKVRENCRDEVDLSDHLRTHTSSQRQHAKTLHKKDEKSTPELKESEDPRTYPCAHCDKKYPNENDLADHMKLHNSSTKQRADNSHNKKKKRFICDPKNSEEPGNYSCFHCDKKYSNKNDLSDHMKTHTGNPEQYLDSSHKKKQEKCTPTSKEPENNRKYSCLHCNKKYPSKTDLSKHMGRHTSTTNQHAENSREMKKRKLICVQKDLDGYRNKKDPKKDDLSDKIKTFTINLKQHTDNLLSKKDEQSTSKPKESKNVLTYFCAYCAKTFPNESDLIDHIKIHKSSAKQHEENVPKEKKRKLVCEPKGPDGPRDKKYPKKDDLPDRITTPTSSTKKIAGNVRRKDEKCAPKPKETEHLRTYSCAHCDKKYSKESHLADHMKSHQSSTKEHVDNSLNKKKNVKDPEASHDEKYPKKDDLSDRMKTPTSSTKPQADNLHKKDEKCAPNSKEPKDLQTYTCVQCDKKYSKESDLTDHLKSHKSSTNQQVDNSLKKKKKKVTCEPNNTVGSRDEKHPKKDDLSNSIITSTNSAEKHADNLLEKDRKSAPKPKEIEHLRTYSCAHCDKKYSKESHLTDHMKSHKSSTKEHVDNSLNKKKKNVKDPDASHDKKYPKKDDLSDRMKTPTSSTKPQSDNLHKKDEKCAPNSKEPKDLQTYTCVQCDKKYSKESDLTDHLKSHKSSTKEHVDNSLNKKKKNVKDPDASHDKKYPKKDDLSDRMKTPTSSTKPQSDNLHKKDEKCAPNSKEPKDLQTYTCVQCDKKYSKESDLTDHLKSHKSSTKEHVDNSHKKKKKKVTCEPKDSDGHPNYSCPHCDKKYSNKSDLSDHMNAHTSSQKEHSDNSSSKKQEKSTLKPKEPQHSDNHSCAHCGKKYLNESDLWEHTKTHTSSTKKDANNSHNNNEEKCAAESRVHGDASSYKCTRCGKKYRNKNDLSDHMRRRHSSSSKKKKDTCKPIDRKEARNYSCTRCDKKYTNESDLTDHMKTHTSNPKSHTDNSNKKKKRKIIIEPKNLEDLKKCETNLSDQVEAHAISSKPHADNSPKEKKRKITHELKNLEDLKKCETNLSDQVEAHAISSKPHADNSPKEKKRKITHEPKSLEDPNKCETNLSDQVEAHAISSKPHADNSPKEKKRKITHEPKNLEDPNKCETNLSDQTEAHVSSPEPRADNCHSKEKSKPLYEPEDAEGPRNYSCPHCDKKYPNKRDLSDHVKMHTSSQKGDTDNSRTKKEETCTPKSEVHKDANSYKCTQCDKKYHNESDLSVHMKRHTSSSKANTHKWHRAKKKKKTDISKLNPNKSDLTDHTKTRERDSHNKEKSKLTSEPKDAGDAEKYETDLSDAAKSHTSSLNQPAKKSSYVRRFRCAHCDKKYCNKDNLREHMKTHMSNLLELIRNPKKKSSYVKRLRCAHCAKQYCNKDNLREHMKTHMSNLLELIRNQKKEPGAYRSVKADKDGYYKCTHCDKKYRRKSDFVDHMKIHTIPGFKDRLKCNICGKTFASLYCLKCHQNVHSTDKSFKCSICGALFKSAPAKARHENKFHVTSDKLYCAHCNYGFKTKFHLTKHILEKHINHKEIRCDICGKEFPYPYLLPEHKLIVHEKKRPFQCTVCDRTFTTIYRMKKHKLLHNSRNAATSDTYCDICEQHYTTLDGMRAHRRRVHEKYKPYECATCGKKFASSKDIKDHTVALHGPKNKKPFKCSVCDMTFQLISNKRSHERSHMKDHRYSCAHCAKKYKAKGYLAKHLKMLHSRKQLMRPYQCTKCGESFVKEKGFNDHLLKGHNSDPDKPFKCTLCTWTFRLKCSLQSHVLRKHKNKSKNVSKSNKPETAEPNETDSSEPKEKDSSEPNEKDSSEPKEKDSSEPNEKDSSEPKEKDSSEPNEKDSSEPNENYFSEPIEKDLPEPSESNPSKTTTRSYVIPMSAY